MNKKGPKFASLATARKRLGEGQWVPFDLGIAGRRLSLCWDVFEKNGIGCCCLDLRQVKSGETGSGHESGRT